MDEENGTLVVEIREAFCRKCGECVEACPGVGDTERPVLQGGRGETARLASMDNCILCFSCVEICRGRAISIQGVKRVPLAAQDDEVSSKVKGEY